MIDFSRRDFLALGAMATCGVTLPSAAGEVTVDPTLSVFCSDIHVSGKNIEGQPTYQNPLFEKVVGQVLAMNPRPKNLVIFGDLSLWKGYSKDYEESLPLIKKVKEAGINVYITTGNHDHREVMYKYYPEYKESSPVPGRFVSVIDLGFADLVLLDTLNETGNGEGTNNAVPGTLDEAQGKWLLEFASKAKRPFFCGAHHPPSELSIGEQKLFNHLKNIQNFAGFIHGHDHMWYTKWAKIGWGNPKLLRIVCLPSTGWWGDIGFATFKTSEDSAKLSLVQNDFFFPKPAKPGEERPKDWDEIFREKKGSYCTFYYR